MLPSFFTWNILQLTTLNPCFDSSSYKGQYRLSFLRKMFCNPAIVNQQSPSLCPCHHSFFQTYTVFSSKVVFVLFTYMFICVMFCLFDWTLSSRRAAIKMMSFGFIYQNAMHILLLNDCLLNEWGNEADTLSWNKDNRKPMQSSEAYECF